MDRMTEKELAEIIPKIICNVNHSRYHMSIWYLRDEIRASWEEIAELKAENEKWQIGWRNIDALKEENATLKARVEEYRERYEENRGQLDNLARYPDVKEALEELVRDGWEPITVMQYMESVR